MQCKNAKESEFQLYNLARKNARNADNIIKVTYGMSCQLSTLNTNTIESVGICQLGIRH